jgi:hypothetical protein
MVQKFGYRPHRKFVVNSALRLMPDGFYIFHGHNGMDEVNFGTRMHEGGWLADLRTVKWVMSKPRIRRWCQRWGNRLMPTNWFLTREVLDNFQGLWVNAMNYAHLLEFYNGKNRPIRVPHWPGVFGLVRVMASQLAKERGELWHEKEKDYWVPVLNLAFGHIHHGKGNAEENRLLHEAANAIKSFLPPRFQFVPRVVQLESWVEKPFVARMGELTERPVAKEKPAEADKKVRPKKRKKKFPHDRSEVVTTVPPDGMIETEVFLERRKVPKPKGSG